MTALITLSHGSRHPHAEPGIRRLTLAAAELLGVDAVAAHLEFDTPTLEVAAVELAATGVARAVVVPLLFTHAYHARHDVPEALEQARKASGLDLLLAPGLGTGPATTGVLVERVRADAPAGAHLVLYNVGSSDTDANQAVIDLAHDVSTATGHSIEVIPATGGPGTGVAALTETCRQHGHVHVLPLFVTQGLLLDRLVDRFGHIQDTTGVRLTHSAPLETSLAGIVAARHAGALSPLLTNV